MKQGQQWLLPVYSRSLHVDISHSRISTNSLLRPYGFIMYQDKAINLKFDNFGDNNSYKCKCLVSDHLNHK